MKDSALVYKPSEVAKLLRCDPRTIYAMIDRGEIEHIKLGRVIRIPKSAVDDLLKGKKATGTGQPRSG